MSEPDGGPSASPRSTPTPPPSSPSDGRESRTSVMSFNSTGGSRSLDVGPLAPSLRVGSGLGLASGPAVFHAKISPSPGSDEAWSTEPAPTSLLPSSSLWGDTNPGSSSSRTYRDFSPVMAGATWRDSSVRWSNSGMAWDTGLSTLATSECRSADGECSSSETRLADVLEPSAPQRFYLSARAAAGILRRASKRGRELPTELAQALTSLAQSSEPPGSDTTRTSTPSSRSPAGRAGGTKGQAPAEPTPGGWSRAGISSSVRRLTPVEC